MFKVYILKKLPKHYRKEFMLDWSLVYWCIDQGYHYCLYPDSVVDYHDFNIDINTLILTTKSSELVSKFKSMVVDYYNSADRIFYLTNPRFKYYNWYCTPNDIYDDILKVNGWLCSTFNNGDYHIYYYGSIRLLSLRTASMETLYKLTFL